MPFAGWGWTEGRGSKKQELRYTHEEAVAIAVAEGFFRGIPAPMLRKLHPGNRDKDPYSLSPSSLSDCLRCRILKTQHDYWLDPKDQLAAFRGSAWHDYLDEGIAGQSEEYLSHEFTVTLKKRSGDTIDVPMRIGARLDYYEPSTATIIDYKTTGTLSVREGNKWVDKPLPTPEHELQVNIYALLKRLKGFPVERAFLHYIASSGTMRGVPVDVWPQEEQLEVLHYFAKRVAKAKAIAPKLPPREEGEEGMDPCRWSPPSIRQLCQELS